MLDPIFGLNPHDGSLLFEVPGDRMVVRHDENRLHISLDEAGLRAYANAAEAKLPLDVAAADKKARPSQTTYFVEDDFKNTNPGKVNMKTFVLMMKKDWEGMHYPLVDDDGSINLGTMKLPG